MSTITSITTGRIIAATCPGVYPESLESAVELSLTVYIAPVCVCVCVCVCACARVRVRVRVRVCVCVRARMYLGRIKKGVVHVHQDGVLG